MRLFFILWIFAKPIYTPQKNSDEISLKFSSVHFDTFKKKSKLRILKQIPDTFIPNKWARKSLTFSLPYFVYYRKTGRRIKWFLHIWKDKEIELAKYKLCCKKDTLCIGIREPFAIQKHRKDSTIVFSTEYSKNTEILIFFKKQEGYIPLITSSSYFAWGDSRYELLNLAEKLGILKSRGYFFFGLENAGMCEDIRRLFYIDSIEMYNKRRTKIKVYYPKPINVDYIIFDRNFKIRVLYKGEHLSTKREKSNIIRVESSSKRWSADSLIIELTPNFSTKKPVFARLFSSQLPISPGCSVRIIPSKNNIFSSRILTFLLVSFICFLIGFGIMKIKTFKKGGRNV